MDSRKEDILKKIEELKAEVEKIDSEKEEENYCVGDFQSITIDTGMKDMQFGNCAHICSLPDGDGVYIDMEYLAGYKITDGRVRIYLKGTEMKNLKQFE